MDKIDRSPEQRLLDAALDAARAHGLKIQVVEREPKLGRARADALVRVEHGGQEVLYAAEVRRALRPATLGIALHQLERLGEQGLLVTDYVTPELAEELRAHRVAFLDAAGNAYLDRPPLLIWVKGQKPAAKPVQPHLGRAFQATGLQVLFALLCNPKAVERPYRELAAMAGVAHGTVGWAMPDLQQLGFVRDLEGRRGTRRLFDGERLVAQWADVYARVLRPRTLIGRFYVPTLEGWKDWPLAEHGALWGGEPAAAKLTDYLRPGELTIYADKLPGLLAARQKFLNEPAPGHAAAVEVRKRFWNFPGETPHRDLVPPLLVYADLLATGDARCIDTARIVYDGYVARLFAEA
ncbi:MAG: type IV toxin-antitoxin system AbiEi family antitoxin [Betaproteobacteria bacterium]